MKKTTIIIFSFLLILIISIPSGISKKNDININILYVGGSGNGNYSSIQNAIDSSVNGDIIFVYKGIYFENITINKSLQIIGENRNDTIIEGLYTDNIVKVLSDDIIFSNFTVKNSGGFFDNSAILIQSNNIKIKNCKLYRNRVGIIFNNSENITLANNLYHANGEAIKGKKTSSILIEKSEFCNNGIGVDLYRSQKIYFNDIYAHENGVVFFINKSSDVKVNHCASCDNNDNGRGISFYNSDNILIENSNAIHSGTGFKIVNSTNISFESCNLEFNTHYTIWIQDNSKNININNCEIVNNFRHGIHITDSICNVSNSNLYNNMIDSVYLKNSYVSAENNYWGSKLGPIFSKGFRIIDFLSKDFGDIKFNTWKNYRFENIGSDWNVDDSFNKTIIKGYEDPPIILIGIDSDLDLVPDWWEEKFDYQIDIWEDHEHLDPDGDALNNIEECFAYEWGSNPYQKDIFIEFDHIKTKNPDISNYLPEKYIDEMKNSFAEHNITLHVDQGELGGGEEIEYVNNFSFSKLVDIYWDYFLNNDLNNPRKNIFHYGLICNQAPGNGFAFMGWAHLNSFCISADLISDTHPMYDRGWLITCGSMHETGHTLGLLPDDFGGNDNHAAIKPKYPDFWFYRNYKSCMNYRYVYTIMDYSDGDNGEIDYSDWDGIEFDFFKNTHFEWPKY